MLKRRKVKFLIDLNVLCDVYCLFHGHILIKDVPWIIGDGDPKMEDQIDPGEDIVI